jgi:hypothetical protein
MKGLKSIGGWLLRVLISIDQFANVLASPLLNRIPGASGYFGYPDETISSALGKVTRKADRAIKHKQSEGYKWARAVCAVLNRIDPGHCGRSIEDDEGIR